MRIDINQQKVSARDKFEIYINGVLTHRASSDLFRMTAMIHLLRNDSNEPVLTLKKKWRWLKAEYDIEFHNGQTFAFTTVSTWKSHYRCAFGGDTFDIYGHRGRKHSIFKNGVQTAWWDKRAVSWFDGDNYAITADDDCVPELLIAFCLIIDNCRSNRNKGNSITIDFGNLIEARRFDAAWQPNSVVNSEGH